MTLIAEDVLLLLLDPARGTVSSWSTWGAADLALGGAVLAELAAAGLVAVDEESTLRRPAKVRVTGAPAPPDLDSLLTEGLRTVAGKELRASSLVPKLGKKLGTRVAARLAEQGVLTRSSSRLLGVLPRTTWPSRDDHRRSELQQAVTTTLALGTTPDERTRTVVALLWAVNLAQRAVTDDTRVPRRDLKRRAAELAEGDWVAKAVADAVAAASSSAGG